jgi:aspartate racemase
MVITDHQTPLMSLGVLGGIGPESTGQFYSELIRIFQAEFRPNANTDFPRILVNSIPAPDLISAERDGKVLKEYGDGLRDLEAWAADVAIVACNSAYCYFDEITRDLTIPVINVRETVLKALQKLKVQRIALIASSTTLRNDLYRFDEYSYTAFSDSDQRRIADTIEQYNLGRASEADLEFVRALARASVQNGDVVLAGCTEIHAILKGYVEHLDPMEEMARAMVAIWVSMKQWEKISSPIHGTGVASRVFIPAGHVAYQIVFAKKSSIFRKHWAYIDGAWYGDGGAFDWLNHSCDPNVEIVMVDGSPALRTLRDVQPGEEITCDYSRTEEGGTKEISCACRASGCRKSFHIRL